MRFHIHWHRRVANPFARKREADYSPIGRWGYWPEDVPMQCRCGHRKLVRADLIGVYRGTAIEVRHWLVTGEWIDPDELLRRLRPPAPPRPGGRLR